MLLRRILLIALCSTLLATEPNDATRRWWSHVQALSNDSLEGRDTGSEGYRKAARYVVAQFELGPDRDQRIAQLDDHRLVV